ncbi:MAG TPA: hypothetical protein VIV40_20050 [Kofleriaceae bacterium]
MLGRFEQIHDHELRERRRMTEFFVAFLVATAVTVAGVASSLGIAW